MVALLQICVLFASCEASVEELGILVTRPLTNFKKASDRLGEHCASKGRKVHLASVERAEAIWCSNGTPSIDHLLSSRCAQLLVENRFKLKSIAVTIIFCGRQALSLRGHHDDGPVLTVIGRGNF